MLVLHTIVNTFTSKRFIEPLVKAELSRELDSKLIIDPIGGDSRFLDELNVEYSIAKFDLTFNPFCFVFRLLSLVFLISKLKPDVIVCHMTKGAFIPLLASRILGVKQRVYYNHGVPYPAYKHITRFVLKAIEVINCYNATKVITVNESLVRYLEDVTSKKVLYSTPGSVCGIPADFRDRYETVPCFNFDIELKNKKVFLYVGRPHSRKGFDLLLQTFSLLEHRDDFLLVIAGCTDSDVKKRFGIKLNNVQTVGTLVDLSPLYAVSDFILLPSYHEGFSMAILEGMTLGCIPVVSSIKEFDLACNSTTAFRFELNVYSFKNTLEKVLELSKDQIDKYKHEAHVNSAKYSEKNVTDKYISLLYK
ncbi:TPA: glycosyltransferase [Vibrio parahaemolyticus]|nr:glycosyltransferase [Vibrio parahaemolyticus]HCH3679730.1 glycosyltransferase [Vibrio parahaemolyticus]